MTRTFLSVAFLNGKDGYIVGRGGEILALRNGTWAQGTESPTRKTIYGITAAPDGQPWVAATTRAIFKKKS